METKQYGHWKKQWNLADRKFNKWINQIWKNPSKAKLPKTIAAKWQILNVLIDRCQEKNLGAFIQFATRLEPLLTLMMVKPIFKRFGIKLSGTKYWIDWFTKNNHCFDVVEAMKKEGK